MVPVRLKAEFCAFLTEINILAWANTLAYLASLSALKQWHSNQLNQLRVFVRRHDTQHNDTQHNNKYQATFSIMTLSVMTFNGYTKYWNAECPLYWVSLCVIMLIVIMLSVIMLSVVMLSVAVPFVGLTNILIDSFFFSQLFSPFLL